MEQQLLDSFWILLAAALVFLMQPGFMCLESGLTRSKNSINVAIKNLADFAFSVLSFWILGYGLMFGASAAGWIGRDGFIHALGADSLASSFFFFQAMFCGTATTIFSGAVAERMRFSSYLITAGVLSTLIYPVFGHWAWNGLGTGELTGWLGAMGFVDFAGSTVVHSVGGWLALAALVVIGPRQGKFPKDGPPRDFTGSNLPLSVLGTLLLWFGWFGFNGGSTLALSAEVPGIIARTTLAGGAGAVSCLMTGWLLSRLPRVTYLINGSLGGLVAITANCHSVDAVDAVIIGAVAGWVCLASEWLLNRLRIDDAVSAVPVHLFCGIWGTLAVALFGDPELIGTGLAFMPQLFVQMLGIFAAFVAAFCFPLALLRVINRFHPLRVTPEQEDVGLNVSEHGARTELADLFQAMDEQVRSRDLALRVPVEPFTEVGHIAARYNQVMDALQEAVSRTEAVIRTAADAIISFGSDTLAIFSANPAAESMFGYSQPAFAGMPVTRLLGMDEPLAGNGKPPPILGSLLEGRRLELTAHRADGAAFPVEVVVTRTHAGNETFFVGSFRDISERRAAQQELAAAERNYRSIFENAVEGIFQSSEEGTYLRVNPALARIYGFDTPEEMVRRLRDIREQLYVEPDRRDQFLEIMRRDGVVASFESQIRRKDGRVIWISENARAVRDQEGRIAYFEGTVQDITARREAEEALRTSEIQYRSFFENSGTATLIIEDDTIIVYMNAEMEKLSGYSRREVEGRMPFTMLVQANDCDRMIEYHRGRRLVPDSAPRNYECEIVTKTGEVKTVFATVSMVPESSRSLACLTDVSDLKRAEADLGVQRAYFRQLFESSPLAIVLIDRHGKIVDLNRSFENLFGYCLDEVRNEYNRRIVVPESHMDEAEALSKEVFSGTAIHKESCRRHRNGRLIPVSILAYPVRIDGEIAGVYYLYEDISERKAFEQQLSHQAFHDPLTQLPNRALFLERLDSALKRSIRRKERNFAVLLIDMDRFKWVNDSLGHLAGDELLIGISRRLESCVRNVDTVARLGGDEFAILLEDFANHREVIQIAKRIKSVMQASFTLEGNEVVSSASIGIVLKTRDYASPDELLRDADIAMYRAKESGKNRFKIFSARMHKEAVRILRMENDLRRALQRDELTLHYQPLVDMNTGMVANFEALVRWNHPEQGLVMPGSFIHLAEETGLIIPLGHWVLEHSVRQLRRWDAAIPGAGDVGLSVNLSGKHLQQPDLVHFVARTLEQAEIEPHRLRLEITESALVQDTATSLERLLQLKALGVQLVIDDFGTGYSSLSYLQRFPVDVLKIDRSFVMSSHKEENAEIIRSIVTLAQSLGLCVVAEGVEEQAQFDRLKALACDYAQGYMFSRPLDADGARKLIGANFIINDSKDT
ncbi:diguanylate cyclase [Oceanidesulfovibrio indonesiensis]|uniref:Diguanylate cyclase n=1 Tax=Oceanidesulfovibrio indonesiensis TaxID=54767 RepID=A0A7M3MKM3_9BACT|nr:ammonium transporter [Oceanidesulfovibrio indonesiensis]TVM19971.1 diguanylate cyclase [Oceanidesulfovibrio indonesiensis]